MKLVKLSKVRFPSIQQIIKVPMSLQTPLQLKTVQLYNTYFRCNFGFGIKKWILGIEMVIIHCILSLSQKNCVPVLLYISPFIIRRLQDKTYQSNACVLTAIPIRKRPQILRECRITDNTYTSLWRGNTYSYLMQQAEAYISWQWKIL